MQLMSARWRHGHRRAVRRATTIALLAVGALTVGTSIALASGGGNTVGSDNGKGILLPTNQRITPLGHRLLDTSGRLLSSSISPDGRFLAALTWNNFTGFLTIVDLRQDKIVQQLGTGSTTSAVIGDGTVAADGPLWSADGHSLWFPQTSDLVHFVVSSQGDASDPHGDPVVDRRRQPDHRAHHGSGPAFGDGVVNRR